MPSPAPEAPIMYEIYLDPSLKAWMGLEYANDDDDFGWQTYFSRRSFRQGVTQASQSVGVKIWGQKPLQKKNKKKQKEDVEGQKEVKDNF